MSNQRRITDDLDVLLGVIPESIVQAVHQANNYDKLLEIILDLGRVPTARYVEEETILREKEITREELDHVVERIGDVWLRDTAPLAIERAEIDRDGQVPQLLIDIDRFKAINDRHGYETGDGMLRRMLRPLLLFVLALLPMIAAAQARVAREVQLPSLLIVAGTSMNAGKTTTAAGLIHGLVRAGRHRGGPGGVRGLVPVRSGAALLVRAACGRRGRSPRAQAAGR